MDFRALEADWTAFYRDLPKRLQVAKSDRIAPILDKPLVRKVKKAEGSP